MNSLLSCELAGRCSGCPWILKPYSEQLEEKKARFGGPGLEIRTTSPSKLRDRADLILETQSGGTVLGLYDFEKKQVLDWEACPLLTEELEQWLQEFRTDLPQIKRGSLRLRVSPQGNRGVWLDFSNLDIKRLLEEGQWLERLHKKATVEIGQKRKRLTQKEGGWGLAEPELFPWSHTFFQNTPLPLYTTIGGFTQSGPKATQVLVDTLIELLPPGVTSWVELGAGSGTFTLPLLFAGKSVLACEIDELAISGLIRSATELGKTDLLRTKQIDFHHDPTTIESILSTAEAVVVDPPRSGLGKTLLALKNLEKNIRPKHFLYISCWEESFLRDSQALQEMGYKKEKMIGIDQFPQGPQMEYMASFSMTDSGS